MIDRSRKTFFVSIIAVDLLLIVAVLVLVLWKTLPIKSAVVPNDPVEPTLLQIVKPGYYNLPVYSDVTKLTNENKAELLTTATQHFSFGCAPDFQDPKCLKMAATSRNEVLEVFENGTRQMNKVFGIKISPAQIYIGKWDGLHGAGAENNTVTLIGINAQGISYSYPTVLHELVHLYQQESRYDVKENPEKIPLCIREGMAKYYSGEKNNGFDKSKVLKQFPDFQSAESGLNSTNSDTMQAAYAVCQNFYTFLAQDLGYETKLLKATMDTAPDFKATFTKAFGNSYEYFYQSALKS